MLRIDSTDDKKPRFVRRSRGYFQEFYIILKALSLDEINAMFLAIYRTLGWINLEAHGKAYIPFRLTSELSVRSNASITGVALPRPAPKAHS